MTAAVRSALCPDANEESVPFLLVNGGGWQHPQSPAHLGPLWFHSEQEATASSPKCQLLTKAAAAVAVRSLLRQLEPC